MKAVINGKRYDTETAEVVISWTNGYYPNDFKFREKSLYRTPKGNWFILHVGGAMTDMAQRAGSNSMTGGSSIEPITADNARQFLESHNGAEFCF